MIYLFILFSFSPLIYTEVGGEVREISVVNKASSVRVLVAIYAGKHHKDTCDHIVRFEISENMVKGKLHYHIEILSYQCWLSLMK